MSANYPSFLIRSKLIIAIGILSIIASASYLYASHRETDLISENIAALNDMSVSTEACFQTLIKAPVGFTPVLCYRSCADCKLYLIIHASNPSICLVSQK